jgi:LCP family protein required for cell wall assembly
MDHGPGRDSRSARLLRALYSALIPGVGQLVAGARRRGLFLVGIFVIVSLAFVVVLSRGTDAILEFAVQPKVLLTLLFLNVLIMLVRMFAVLDAWMTGKAGSMRSARPSRREATLTGIGLALILFFCITPHAIAGYYAAVSHNLLTSVFSGSSEKTTTTLASPGRAGPEGNPTAESTSPLNPGSDEQLTILLIGTDEGRGRWSARADSINIATVNLKTGKVAIFGIPRNMGEVPLGKKTAAALKKTRFDEIVNGLYTRALPHPEIAPDGGDPGAEAVKETAELMLGIPIDYYAVVNMLGLVEVVDAFGGVDVNVKTRLKVIHSSGLTEGDKGFIYYLEPGVHHLNGRQTLDFTRSRADGYDYDRMQRQRCVLLALLYQNGLGSLTLKFPKIARALERNVKTDIPADVLPRLISLRGQIDTGQMIALALAPPDYITGSKANLYNIPNIPAIKAAVKSILADPDQWIVDHAQVSTQRNGARQNALEAILGCYKVTE